jgi:circadian clock protein KaiC
MKSNKRGEYDLKGLFVRIHHAIESPSGLSVLFWIRLNHSFLLYQIHAVVRTELRRLFGWLKKKGVTTIVTGEKGDATINASGFGRVRF